MGEPFMMTPAQTETERFVKELESAEKTSMVAASLVA